MNKHKVVVRGHFLWNPKIRVCGGTGGLLPPLYSKKYWFWRKMIRDKSTQNHHITQVWATLEVHRTTPEDFRGIFQKSFHEKHLFIQVLGRNFWYTFKRVFDEKSSNLFSSSNHKDFIFLWIDGLMFLEWWTRLQNNFMMSV